jgi:predicted GNAT family acetyltransferase
VAAIDESRIAVRDVPEQGQYVVSVDGADVGVARYVESGTVRTFTHTEVDPSMQGTGVGSVLVREAVRDVRRRDLQLIALCPYVKAWLKKHPGEV